MRSRAEASTDIGRRRLVMALPLLGGGLLSLAGSARGASPIQQRSSRRLMGTQLDIAVEGSEPARLTLAVERAYAEMARLSNMMSRYVPTSPVSAIGLMAGVQPVAVPAELMRVLLDGQALAQQTGGAFDMTVGALKAWRFDLGQIAKPSDELLNRQAKLIDYRRLILNQTAGTAYLSERGMALDLGGIAKLPILEAGMRILAAEGIRNALINGGGDVFYRGNWQGRPWRVGLRDPRQPQQLLGVVALEGEGLLASSGDYERGFVSQDGQRQHHILDPRSGRPTQGPHGLSLLAQGSRAVKAVNGLGAAIMVDGLAAGRRHIEASAGLAGLIVDQDGSVWQSAGMAEALRRRTA
ncbi:FAD:protein FMN transferase [Roseateles oligotrophus]|uniref:FAD:protein FMN transferase n=1 Tax=Roseateles oligotrophus TaxID=1769250 RepID=A0ABT2YKM4_9BURK|nr:FAD:protein FMN transferase [Roseateles oligotrophus]MCV2370598.1 FAD:protein FMN transferase [Roseateles oligotrophus]